MRAHALAVTLATFHQLSVASHQATEWPQYGQANRSSFGLQRICRRCSQQAPCVPNRSRNVLMFITAGFGSEAVHVSLLGQRKSLRKRKLRIRAK